MKSGLVTTFFNNINKSGPYIERLGSKCWLWLGSKAGRGYGKLAPQYHCIAYSAHRFMWTLENGPIPKGMYICHHCDNPSCVNPAHLFLGTPKDNAHDKVSKGRANHPRGEKSGLSKLTENDVKDIRHMYAVGHTQEEIAGQYCVSRVSISYIVNRVTWKHVK